MGCAFCRSAKDGGAAPQKPPKKSKRKTGESQPADGVVAAAGPARAPVGPDLGLPAAPQSPIISALPAAQVAQVPAAQTKAPSCAEGVSDPAALRQVYDKQLDLPAAIIIDEEKVLAQCSGDRGFLVEILTKYCDMCRTSFSRLDGEIEAGKWREMAETAHSLKGAAANMFARRMQVVCLELEKTGKAAPADVATRSRVLMEFLRETFVEFEGWLRNLSAAAH
eukprot:TRINITY_DN6374_c0_g1_i1.p1 TRINITY_DN6374_c0_g1~~TRINITY_DN6374_c0_g1_i1.p1  ORF type:complete len:223 (-),score=33.85 TRINITY_DN6374_c0_g1_i1:292-960(-)